MTVQQEVGKLRQTTIISTRDHLQADLKFHCLINLVFSQLSIVQKPHYGTPFMPQSTIICTTEHVQGKANHWQINFFPSQLQRNLKITTFHQTTVQQQHRDKL